MKDYQKGRRISIVFKRQKIVNRKYGKNNKVNEEVEVQRTNAKNIVLSLQSCSFILSFTLIEGQFDENECSLYWFPAAFVLTLWRYVLSTRFVFFTCTGAVIEKKVTRWLPNNAFDEVRQTVYLYSGFVCLSQRAGNWRKPESTTQKCLHKLYLLWSAQKQIQSLALTKPRWSWKPQVCKLLHY